MESTELIPLSGDIAKITRRAEEFKDLHESLQRNLQTYLPLTMDALAGVHQKVKSSIVPDATRQMASTYLTFTSYVTIDSFWFVDIGSSATKIKIAHDLCRNTEVSDVTGCLFISC